MVDVLGIRRLVLQTVKQPSRTGWCWSLSCSSMDSLLVGDAVSKGDNESFLHTVGRIEPEHNSRIRGLQRLGRAIEGEGSLVGLMAERRMREANLILIGMSRERKLPCPWIWWRLKAAIVPPLSSAPSAG